MTVWQLVVDAAERHPKRVVVADEHGRSLTTIQLRSAAERVAAGLGVAPGQVVSWQLPSTLEAVVLLIALARIGAVQNPIIPILREREIGMITTQIRTSLLVVPEMWRGFAHGDMARSLANGCGFDVMPLDLESPVSADLRLPEGDPRGLGAVPDTDDECRWIYFSSGTTATPKGIRHTDASLTASSDGIADRLGFREGDVYPIAWPVSHIGGITMISTVLRQGGKLVMFESFDPATIGDRMSIVKPTILGTGVPFFRAYLDAQKRHGFKPLFGELRAFVAGGAPTPPELIAELGDVFGVRSVVNSWGLTEFPIATCQSPTDPRGCPVDSVGAPSPGVRVRSVDGELRLKGPQCFLGYVDTDLDADAFDDEGWFRTGDLGTIDRHGLVSITGRIKDLIIRNGENISAPEIEAILLSHPGIKDVAIIALPSEQTGECVCAVVVPNAEAQVTLETIAAHCADHGLARQKTPEAVRVVDLIPRNPMGKVVKADLRMQILGSSGNQGMLDVEMSGNGR
jgi:cyclohexanecarboxylate-CoA ligase